MLGGALWLRRCTDECHGAVLGPLTVTVLLAPAGVGLLVAGLAAWDRAGRAVPASRAVQMALLGAGAGALVGVGVGAMIGYRPAAAGNGLLVYELFAFVNLAALGATAVVMGRRLG